jgi:hypothetical protein
MGAARRLAWSGRIDLKWVRRMRREIGDP